MEEELQKALAEMVNKTVSALESGASFVASEIPDVAQQLLMWKLAESLAFFLVGLILIFTPVVLLFKYGGVGEKEEVYHKPTLTHNIYGRVDEHKVVPFGFVSGVSAIVGLFCLNLNWLYILLAPKAYLIVYAAKLIK